MTEEEIRNCLQKATDGHKKWVEELPITQADVADLCKYALLGRACEANGLASFAEDGSHRFQAPADIIKENAYKEGWNDREADLIARVNRLGAPETREPEAWRHAIEQAAGWFDEYVELHRGRGPEHAHKMMLNEQRAIILRRALESGPR